MAYNKEKQQILVSSLTSIGALAGNGVIGGIKGLEMSAEQAKCDDEASAVRDGLFKIVVIGTFSCGKSTFINALIGSKILPDSILPCTAILTFIQYGTDENRADVYMVDEQQADGSIKEGECIHMNIEDFKNQYKYSIEDEKIFKKTGSVPRFAKVKYAIIYSSKPIMESGVSIIDSPGLEDKAIASELAINFAQKAQAIIFVTLERGFAECDKEYLYSNFKNCPKNVFFVTNRFDLITTPHERKQTLQKMKDEVSPIFTNEKGEVNYELINRRVFGISALRALDARRGVTFDVESETERTLSESERKAKLEKSWFTPFEQELETFLTTDEKCIAQYQKCFKQMASTYRNVEKQIADYVYIYENEIQMDTQKRSECEKIISDIQKNIDLTRVTFDNCSLKIQNAFSDLLSGCATSIDSTWEQDMEELSQKVDIGIFKYMWQGIKGMNPLASKQKKEEDLKKFAGKFIDVVAEYFADRIESYITENKLAINKVVDQCQEELNININKTDLLFKDLAKELINGKDASIRSEDTNWLQIIISTYLGDFSNALRGGIDGKIPWMDYLKKTIINTLWQGLLIAFLGGTGVILAILIEFLQGNANKNATVRRILVDSKDDMIKAIRLQTEEMKETLNKNISKEIDDKKVERCADDHRRLADEQKRMLNIEEFYARHNSNLEMEKKRYDNILSTMYQEAANAYSVVFDKQLTLEQFKQF